MQEILKEKIEDFRTVNIDCSIYLFGSYLWSELWSDLDFIVIYKKYDDICLIKEFFFHKLNEIPLDITFMTMEEEKHFNFIKETKAKKIYP